MKPYTRSATHVALLTLFLLLPQAAGYAQGISLSGEPVRSDTLPSGGSVTGTIAIRNASDSPREARVYQTDLNPLADGSTSYAEPGTNPRSNAPWMTITPHQVTVPAKGTAIVNYLLRVPADVALKGTYWSVIMVEGIAPASLEPPKDPAKLVYTVKTVIRYATQVVTNVGSTGTRDLRFIDKQVVIVDGKQVLQLTLSNTGDCLLRPALWTELYDEQGETKARVPSRQKRLYPGCVKTVSFDLSSVPKGKYTAVVVADNGDDNVFGAQYDLEL